MIILPSDYDEIAVKSLRYLSTRSEGSRRRDILEFLCEGHSHSDKNTISVKLQGRLKRLVSDELVGKEERSHKCVIFKINPKKRCRIDNLIKREDLKNAPEALVSTLHKLMIKIEQEGSKTANRDGDEQLWRFLQGNCIGFIGYTPYNFTKSLEGMKAALNFEQNIGLLASREKISPEEYLTRELEKIKNAKKGEKLITLLESFTGLSKNQLEEILKKQ